MAIGAFLNPFFANIGSRFKKAAGFGKSGASSPGPAATPPLVPALNNLTASVRNLTTAVHNLIGTMIQTSNMAQHAPLVGMVPGHNAEKPLAESPAANAVKGQVGRLRGIGESLGKTFGSIIGGGEKTVATLGKVGGALGAGVSAGLGLLAGGIAAVATAAIAATAATIGLADKFVAMANPAVANQFAMAVDDIGGVIGQILTPVLVAMTQVARQFGDTLKTLAPNFKPFVDAVVNVVKSLGSLIGPSLQAFSVYLNLLAPLIDLAAGAIEKLGQVIKWFADHMVDTYNELASSWVGRQAGFQKLAKLSDLPKQSSFGAAVKPASYQDIEELGRKSSLAAFSAGTTGGLTPDGDAITIRLDKLIEQGKNESSGAGDFRDALRRPLGSWSTPSGDF